MSIPDAGNQDLRTASAGLDATKGAYTHVGERHEKAETEFPFGVDKPRRPAISSRIDYLWEVDCIMDWGYFPFNPGRSRAL